MIGKVTRGGKVAGLLRYLYGPGRFNEHQDPHLVAAWDGDLESLEPVATSAGGYRRFDVRALAAALGAPLAAMGTEPLKSPVWQASLRTAPEDRTLTDQEWRQIAVNTMDRVGLARLGESGAVRWLAVRHADDHVHLVATLAREDGRPVRLYRDFLRLREAAQAAETKFGLRSTAPADKTAAQRPKRAETEKAARNGATESVRETLRRHVRIAAAGAFTEADFWRRLQAEGVIVKQRFSERNPGEVTGYAVGLTHGRRSAHKAGVTGDGDVLLFSGGKLAPDLSLPKLRTRWASDDTPLGPLKPLQGEAREQAWAAATAAAAVGAEHVRAHTAGGDHDGAADAAWATADVLNEAARVLEDDEPGPMQAAADDYDRAARAAFGRMPFRTTVGSELRMGAVMLAMIGRSRTGDAVQVTALLMQLTRLVEAVAEMREAQGHAAQAAAALRVAETTSREREGYSMLLGAATGRTARSAAATGRKANGPGPAVTGRTSSTSATAWRLRDEGSSRRRR